MEHLQSKQIKSNLRIKGNNYLELFNIKSALSQISKISSVYFLWLLPHILTKNTAFNRNTEYKEIQGEGKNFVNGGDQFK